MPVLARLSYQVKWEPFVLADINLGSFLSWAERTETSELEEILAIVNLSVHRGLGIPVPVQVRSKTGAKFLITQLSCNRGECDRCTRGASGYYFQWTSSRWTPRLAVLRWGGLARYPNEAKSYCTCVPFPVGLIDGEFNANDARRELSTIFEQCLSFEPLAGSWPLPGHGQNGERIQLRTTCGAEGRGEQAQGVGATGDVSMDEAGPGQAGNRLISSNIMENSSSSSDTAVYWSRPSFEQFFRVILTACLEK
jgi:hypothetical protein